MFRNRKPTRRLPLNGLRVTLAAAFAAASWVPSVAAQGAGGAVADAPAPVVPDRADRLLQAMGAYLAGAEEVTFSADVTFDHVLPTGQKLQFAAVEDVAVARPNRVRVDWRSDLGERQFWYDGTTVTVADPATPFFAEAPAPETLDATLAMAETELDFAPPLADFLLDDPYQALRAGIRFGVDLGSSEVAGRECDSFAFVGDEIDWQIWIDSGPRPTPCKLLITYTTRPGKPQFSAIFTDWNFAPRIAPETFQAALPPRAQKIPFKTGQSAASQP
jgi:hypothetical protein